MGTHSDTVLARINPLEAALLDVLADGGGPAEIPLYPGDTLDPISPPTLDVIADEEPRILAAAVCTGTCSRPPAKAGNPYGKASIGRVEGSSISFFPPTLRGSTADRDMRIRLRNGSVYQVVGSDNYNSLMGTNPIGIVFFGYIIANPKHGTTLGLAPVSSGVWPPSYRNWLRRWDLDPWHRRSEC